MHDDQRTMPNQDRLIFTLILIIMSSCMYQNIIKSARGGSYEYAVIRGGRKKNVLLMEQATVETVTVKIHQPAGYT